jgi:single-stranded DNA-binding protein
VCTFWVATSRFAGRKEAGGRLAEVEWTTVEAWVKLAETGGRFSTRTSESA